MGMNSLLHIQFTTYFTVRHFCFLSLQVHKNYGWTIDCCASFSSVDNKDTILGFTYIPSKWCCLRDKRMNCELSLSLLLLLLLLSLLALFVDRHFTVQCEYSCSWVYMLFYSLYTGCKKEQNKHNAPSCSGNRHPQTKQILSVFDIHIILHDIRIVRYIS